MAYWPATHFSDTWAYVEMAYGKGFIGLDPSRPSGYPLLMRILSLPGRELGVITTLQHLTGLVVAGLIYALLLRLEVPRAAAVAGAALVALNAHAIAVEQSILAEAFFTLALVVACYLAITARGRGWLVLAGLLLGAAVTMRNQAVFAVPVWALFLAWRLGWARALLPVAAAVLTLASYGLMHQQATGRFGLVTGEGWFMYARVTLLGGCGDADVPAPTQPICARIEPDPPPESDVFSHHAFYPDSPAAEVLGSTLYDLDPARRDRVNSLLRRFALAVIRERPVAYARSVAEEFARYFTPGVASAGDNDNSITFPDRGRVGYVNEQVRREQLPGYRQQVRAPAGALMDYQRILHTPRWLMALFALAGVAALLARLVFRRAGFTRHREVFLLVGLPLAMLLGAAAAANFALRLMIPVLPLLVCGGIVAIAELARAVRSGTGAQDRQLAGEGEDLSAAEGVPRVDDETVGPG